jgi:hypothetical protein
MCTAATLLFFSSPHSSAVNWKCAFMQMEEHMRIVMAEGYMVGAKPTGTAEYAAMAQARLLEMLNASRSEYSVVFTTGLKASYRLVANAYPFQKNSPLLLCQDNHDAVNQVSTTQTCMILWRCVVFCSNAWDLSDELVCCFVVDFVAGCCGSESWREACAGSA